MYTNNVKSFIRKQGNDLQMHTSKNNKSKSKSVDWFCIFKFMQPLFRPIKTLKTSDKSLFLAVKIRAGTFGCCMTLLDRPLGL